MRKAFLFFVFLSWGCLSVSLAVEAVNTGGNAPWRTVEHVQNAIGTTNYTWDGTNLCFSRGPASVKFFAGRRRCEVNGVTVWLNAMPDGHVEDGSWRLSGVDFDLLHMGILSSAEGKRKPLRVLIDAGHGGDDGGACSDDGTVREKDVTLAVAARVGAVLATNGFTVCYTRTNDVDLSLGDRVRKAESLKADIFVSVHVNQAGNAGASGVETYILPASGYPGTADGSSIHGWQPGNRNDFANTLLGYSIQRSLSGIRRDADRGVKRQAFYVLRAARCPAALVEIGFLSHSGEAASMRRNAWQGAQAAAIAAGICRYAACLDSLQNAVAEKRARDQEANDRWRKHLTALKETPKGKPRPVVAVAAAGTPRGAKLELAPMEEPEEDAPTPVAIEVPGIPPPAPDDDDMKGKVSKLPGDTGDSMGELLQFYGMERGK